MGLETVYYRVAVLYISHYTTKTPSKISIPVFYMNVRHASKKKKSATKIHFMNKSVQISLRVNIFWKGMSLSNLFKAMNKQSDILCIQSFDIFWKGMNLSALFKAMDKQWSIHCIQSFPDNAFNFLCKRIYIHELRYMLD